MSNKLPAITGKQLIRLFECDGWSNAGRRTHGIAFSKVDDSGIVRLALIPDKNAPLPDGTLAAILGVKQSCLGRKGLEDLINRYGLK